MGFDRIAVLGAGAWGTALANVLARAGRRVTLWARDPAAADTIARTRENARLPGIALESSIAVTSEASDASSADAVLLAVPAQASREVAARFGTVLQRPVPVVACAKGIERGTRCFLTDIV